MSEKIKYHVGNPQWPLLIAVATICSVLILRDAQAPLFYAAALAVVGFTWSATWWGIRLFRKGRMFENVRNEIAWILVNTQMAQEKEGRDAAKKHLRDSLRDLHWNNGYQDTPDSAYMVHAAWVRRMWPYGVWQARELDIGSPTTQTNRWFEETAQKVLEHRFPGPLSLEAKKVADRAYRIDPDNFRKEMCSRNIHRDRMKYMLSLAHEIMYGDNLTRILWWFRQNLVTIVWPTFSGVTTVRRNGFGRKRKVEY